MSNEVIKFYIAEEIRQFSNAKKTCCKKLCGLASLQYRNYIEKMANNLHIKMHISEYNGHDAVILFKANCVHIIMDSMKSDLTLTPQTIKDMYKLHIYSGYMNSEKEIEMSKEFHHSMDSPLPKVTSHKFFGNQKKVVTDLNELVFANFAKDCFLEPYKHRILNALQCSRILIISSERKLDKAIAISMFIMEKCSLDKNPYKILLVQKDELIANYSSERLSRYFNENVGKTIGFQVQLQTRVGNSASIICTTSDLLLRVLMGESVVKCFEHITHIVVDDVHLHFACTDILLHELRVALKYCEHLKIILLSDSPHENQIFLSYFGEGELINLDESNCLQNVCKAKVLYVEHIYQLLPVNRLSYLATQPEIINNALILDKCLEAYEKSPTDVNFDAIIYMINGENASINYRHSKSGRTAIILASLLGKVEHMEILLKLQADPGIVDSNHMNAVDAAISMGNKKCCDLLNYFHKYQHFQNVRNDCLDYGLIMSIIFMITTSQKLWQIGDIIVLLPSYECLIRIHYYILNQRLLGNLPERIVVHLLHHDIEKEQLDKIVKSYENIVKIILATDIIESLQCIKNIRYVIDSGRIQRRCYNDITASIENTYNWASKQRLESRKHLINSNDDGICFRLIRQDLFAGLPTNNEPDLHIIGLDRICLTVKLLSPNTTIVKYFQDTIVQPPVCRILQCVEYLQKIGILSERQDVTWLGCRLIDVPIECSLGKLLVFSILMQCLDPILTIVSFMNTCDPFNLYHHFDDFKAFSKDSIKNKIKQRKLTLSERISSDHFLYLRLYQEWQNRSQCVKNYHQYMVNSLLEYISLKRSYLLRTLRCSQLVHSKGILNMHNINLKSNCWSIVKAVLVAGIYPNICYIDNKSKRIKSPYRRELILHPDSILRENELSSLKNLHNDFNSTWMVFSNMSDSWHCNSVKFCTLVTPISIALFAGPMKMSASNIQLIDHNSESVEVKLYIDEWITFNTDIRQALLLLKTRQYFYSIYNDFLQFCSCRDYSQNIANSLQQHASVLECIEKILTKEDKALNFEQPTNTDFRPKVLPYKFRDVPDSGLKTDIKTSNIMAMKVNIGAHTCQTKEFYMALLRKVDCQEIDNLSTYEKCEWFPLLNDIIAKRNVDKGVIKFFIITYSRNPNTLLKVLLGKWRNDQLNLMECQSGNILIQNIVPLLDAVKNEALLAIFNNGSRFSWIDNDLGELLVNTFAFNIDGLLAKT